MKNLFGYFIGGAIVGFIGSFVYSVYRMSSVAKRINDMCSYPHGME